MTALLDPRVARSSCGVALTGGPQSLAGVLGGHLATGTRGVAVLSDSPDASSGRHATEGDGIAPPVIACGFGSRGEIADSLRAAASTVGEIGGIVHARVPPVALERRELRDVDDRAWEEGCEEALHETVLVLQAAFDTMAGSGGSIVLVVPTITFVGAAGFSLLAGFAEGVRGLAKSVARSWGRHGIRVNCVAAPPDAYDGAFGAASPADLQMMPRSLPGESSLREVSSVVDFLLGDGSSGMTGETLCVDGGSWMPA